MTDIPRPQDPNFKASQPINPDVILGKERSRWDGLIKARDVAPGTRVKIYWRNDMDQYSTHPTIDIKEIRETKQKGNPRIIADGLGKDLSIAGGTFVKPVGQTPKEFPDTFEPRLLIVDDNS